MWPGRWPRPDARCCGWARNRARRKSSTPWRRALRVDDIRAASRLLKSAGIEVGFFLQFGYPGETWDDIEATLQLTRELQPADIGVSVSYPLPGTRFYERVQQQLGPKQNWIDSNDLSTMYKATYAAGGVSQRARPGASRISRAQVRARADGAAAIALGSAAAAHAPGRVMGLQPSRPRTHPPAAAAVTVRRLIMAASKPKVVLYNPRAVFYTMPLALVALGLRPRSVES